MRAFATALEQGFGMDATESMVAGAIGGIASLLLQLVAAPWLSMTRSSGSAAFLPPSYGSLIVQMLLKVLAAALLGALFFLSWGLAAVVNVAWWQRGAGFAVVCWAALAMPVLVSVRMRIAFRARWLSGWLIEWLLTCLGAGLACAWANAHLP